MSSERHLQAWLKAETARQQPRKFHAD